MISRRRWTPWNTATRLAISIAMTINLLAPLAAKADDGRQPTLIKGKFAVPISRKDVEADWTARGYSAPKMEVYPRGWSRGEHTHPVSLIMTLASGRMEFVFAGQRLIVEPGDELSYAAQTEHAARNTYDGPTQMLESYKK